MKKVCRIMSMCIAFAMTASVMSGCGINKAGKEGDMPTLVWYMQKPVSDMSHQEMVEAEANKIIEQEIGARLKFQFIDSGAWADKVNVLISSGEEFDLILDQSRRFTNNVNKNAYLDIKDYIDEYAPDIKAKVDKFAWDAVTYDGAVYAVPSQTFYVPYGSFAFKKDLVEKYNFDYENVTEYSDLEPFFENIKKNEVGIYPVCVTANTGLPTIQSNDYLQTSLTTVKYDVANDEFVSILDSLPDMERFKTTFDFNKKGYIASDASTKTETVSEIKSGKYATFAGRRSAEKTTSLYGFECVESKPTYGAINRNNVTNSVTAISRTSKHPQKAIELLNLIWKNRDLSNLLAYGIENVDYVVVSGKGTDEISIEPKSGIDVKWSIWHNWLGPLWDQWDSTWNTTEALNEMKQLNESAPVSPIIGFEPDLSELKTEVSMLSSVETECITILNTGAMPDFDEYINVLKGRYAEAGMEVVLKAMNTQYAEWKASK